MVCAANVIQHCWQSGVFIQSAKRLSTGGIFEARLEVNGFLSRVDSKGTGRKIHRWELPCFGEGEVH
jgi:hypothetical protein